MLSRLILISIKIRIRFLTPSSRKTTFLQYYRIGSENSLWLGKLTGSTCKIFLLIFSPSIMHCVRANIYDGVLIQNIYGISKIPDTSSYPPGINAMLPEFNRFSPVSEWGWIYDDMASLSSLLLMVFDANMVLYAWTVSSSPWMLASWRSDGDSTFVC